jgi:MFS family permease
VTRSDTAVRQRSGREHPTLSLTVLIVNQLLAGVGVASGVAVGALLADAMTGTVALSGLAQTASVLGAGVSAIPLARLAVRRGRHIALASGYLLALAGAVLVLVAAGTGIAALLFVGLAFFGAGSAAGLQARFAATEIARPGFEARSMSVVLWATTLGAVAGPNLSELGDQVGRSLGLPPLVGPFLFSGVAFAASTLLVGFLLRMPAAGSLAEERPDAAHASEGIEVAGPPAADPIAAPTPRAVGAFAALRIAVREPKALLAIVAIVCSQTVMVGVMVITPVHMHGHDLSLGLIGLAISIHVLGMYGASPIMGWLVDRLGSIRVIIIGIVILALGTGIGVFAEADGMVLVSLVLGLLGLGWSAGLIGGSALLTLSVDRAIRVPLQGATDAAMNLAAAGSAALSGLVLGLGGFAAVNLLAAVVLVPIVVAAVRVGRIARRSKAVG